MEIIYLDDEPNPATKFPIVDGNQDLFQLFGWRRKTPWGLVRFKKSFIYIYVTSYIFLLLRVNLLSAIFASSNSANGVLLLVRTHWRLYFLPRFSCFVCGRLLSCLSLYSLFRLLSVVSLNRSESISFLEVCNRSWFELIYLVESSYLSSFIVV